MTGVDGSPIPHRIGLLPRDRRGYPVPFVASWSSDRSPDERAWEWATVSLPGVEWFGNLVMSTDVVGEGVPILGQVDPRRQLDGHLTPRCNVCGQVIGSKLVFVGGNPKSMTEAPLHRECARWSISVCPGLLARRGRDLWVVETRSAERRYVGEFVDPFAPDSVARRWMMFSETNRFHGLLTLRTDPGGRAWRADDWMEGP